MLGKYTVRPMNPFFETSVFRRFCCLFFKAGPPLAACNEPWDFSRPFCPGKKQQRVGVFFYQPLCKMCNRQIGSFFAGIGVTIKTNWSHHLGKWWCISLVDGRVENGWKVFLFNKNHGGFVGQWNHLVGCFNQTPLKFMRTSSIGTLFPKQGWTASLKKQYPNWLVVSTHLKNISQIGNLPQIGVKTKNIWNHHLDKNPNHSLELGLRVPIPCFESGFGRWNPFPNDTPRSFGIMCSHVWNHLTTNMFRKITMAARDFFQPAR